MMQYVVKLNDTGGGIVPEPDELEVLIRAALAAVPEYHCYNVEVDRLSGVDKYNIEARKGPIEIM